jgi:nicotinate-nucleotide adenylyltransferase
VNRADEPQGVSAPATVVFGGSFNPPHLAHLLAVVVAQATIETARVLVVPTFRHPFGKVLAPFEERLALCELAFEGLENVEISRAEEEIVAQRLSEGKGPGEGRTLDLLEFLQTKYPNDALRLLVGADILVEAPKWHRWGAVCELAPPIVLGRAGVLHAEAPPPVLPEVSSTLIRTLLATAPQDPRLAAWVPRKVLARIADRALYQAP